VPFQIVRNDITTMQVDVIVNSAHPDPTVGGGVDHAIHNTGGKDLMFARMALGPIRTSEVHYTKAYDLPSTYVFHTVGPVWNHENGQEQSLLASCYTNALRLAQELSCESIAFPLISSGVFGFPKDLALDIARSTILSFLEEHELMVYLVVYDADSYRISKERFDGVISYIKFYDMPNPREAGRFEREFERRVTRSAEIRAPQLDDIISIDDFEPVDATWQEALLEWIKVKEKTNPEVYKKANLTKQHFSKILKDPDYRPTKPTAIAFCFALELSLDESLDLLEKAGYTLSYGIRFDVIIRYFLDQGIHDIFEVNEVLFDFRLDPLGSTIES
jgi:O-acetyl-ADP-ribose deacetylase (regulator of RNase III)